MTIRTGNWAWVTNNEFGRCSIIDSNGAVVAKDVDHFVAREIVNSHNVLMEKQKPNDRPSPCNEQKLTEQAICRLGLEFKQISTSDMDSIMFPNRFGRTK